ncbi:uncharacterized protein FFB14_01613 [Fusarium fujikuroi]|nr:uncharacterized protein FFB14_01613 [Fusarium fujikuroi]
MSPSKRHRPRVPLDKRKRAVRACLSCRESKKKCVMISGYQCQECTRYGLRCTFEPILEDPGNHLCDVVSEPHGSTVWDKLAIDVSRRLREEHPGIKLNSEQFSIVSNLFSEAVQERGPLLFPQSDSSIEQSSTALGQVPQLRVVSGFEVSDLPVRGVKDHAPSASHASFLAAVSETIPPVCSTDEDDRSYTSSLAQEDDAFLINNIIDQIPPREVSEALVALFFTFLESNWYYFDEKRFWGLLTHLYADRASAQQLHPTDVCQVLLVLALASTFKHLAEPFEFANGEREVPGSKLFANATRLLSRVIAANSVESVTCFLLMSLYLLATDDIEHHHIYLGLALNQAVGLSMHRAGVKAEETPEAREVKGRIFWTVYTVERLTSGVMGLPTMLQVKDISVSLPQKRKDLDGDSDQAVDRLIAIIKLTMGMDEIINEGPIEKRASTYEWALFKMESLRTPASMGVSKTLASSFRADAHLQIIYQMIWVSLGRSATLRTVRQSLQPTSVLMSPGDQEAHLRSQNLVEHCREAATTIIDWISQLHHRGLLAKYSFTDFHTCSSATIMLLLYSILDPNHDSLPITQGINALHFMAEGSRLAMNALRLIRRLQETIQKSIGVNISGSAISQPSLSQMASSQDLSETQTIDGCRNISYDSTGNYESHVLPNSPSLFPDLEPWLLEYSDPYSMMFGFDGSCSAFNTDTPYV